MLYAFIFILGSIVGSFLNVCIWRMPRNESIIKPASHCPECKGAIKWFHNVPVISFMLLGGRCANCAAKISARYPAVELLTACLFLVNFAYFGPGAQFLAYTLLGCGLIVAAYTDFSHMIIPDEVTLGGLTAGLIMSSIFPELHGASGNAGGLLSSFLGAAAGGFSIYITGVIGAIIFKKEAMGGGDVKLMAMIGAFVGWRLVLLVFFMAPFFGSFVGIYLKLFKKKDVIPYGPYLALATIICIFWGERILDILFYA